jgi:signal transduction histidine kinase
MENLQKAAQKLSMSRSQSDKLDSLSKAFEIFSEESVRLETAYKSLNEHFQHLNVELQESNHQLQNKVAELDVITQYLKSILDNISQGILFIDFRGVITTYNHAARKILNLLPNEILMTSFWKCFDDRVFGFSMKEALHSKKAPTFSTVTYKDHNQQPCELEISTTFTLKNTAMQQHGGSASTEGLILMIRDITEIRQLQMIANRADRLKELGEMAAQVAHEIRNPLGGIKGFASLLQRDLADKPELKQMATYIVEGTDNLNTLVTQVLQYARPLQPHFEDVDMVVWMEEFKHHVLADPAVKSQNITIDLVCKEAKLPLNIDIALFQSAMLNLIFNAIQAMPNGGTVTIHLEKHSQTTSITISDNGIGIPKENLVKIFSPFFTTKAEGTGLGLAEVQKVIQAHGGTIELTSEVDKGTSFTITIPNKQR